MSVRVENGQFRVDDRLVPLLSGEIHFWRLDPSAWDPVLARTVEAGIPIVATYVSWRCHEPAPGRIDLVGATNPRLDIRAFLERCRAHGLMVHLKPGPWICAEEPNGGYPDWLLEDTEILALDAMGCPIRGYEAPWEHPVPSYLHPRYLAAARRWLGAVDESVRDFVHPAGPIVLVQLDNEPSHAFRDTMYGADYHPLVVERFRRWVARRHGGLDGVSRAWGRVLPSVTAIEPPRAREPRDTLSGSGARRRAHDWIDFRTWILAEHLRRLRAIHLDAGLGQALFTANYNEHPVETVPQDPRAIRRATRGIGGPDLYFEPPLDAGDIVRLARTIALARAIGEPILWAPEIQAGIWRAAGRSRKHPDPTLDEQAFWLEAAIAFGLRGLNLYMLAGREHWDLAPIDEGGETGWAWPAAGRAARLIRAVHELGTSRPISRVAVLMDRGSLKDAHVALGAARRPAVIQPWLAVFRALMDAGHLPEIWLADGGPDPEVSAVVCPPGSPSRTGRSHQASGARRGWSLVNLARDELSGARVGERLRALGIEPPVQVDVAGGLAILHRGARGNALFVMGRGSVPALAAVRFADPLLAGRLVPLLGDSDSAVLDAGRATIRLQPGAIAAFAIRPVDATGRLQSQEHRH